ncbi:MAG: hypothetical protein VB080_13355 [Propionicimonas sp.]|nr:hypothetical protein [Propionicimonas sp.]
MKGPRRTLIVGAAGRDFHTFNTIFRQDADHRVVGFTSREYCVDDSGTYPATLAGPLYPDGVPILPEVALEELIVHLRVDDVVFAYTETRQEEVGQLASRVLAAGADFRMIAPARLMLPTSRPVIAVSAARAGAGKSPTASYLAELLLRDGWRVAVVRHPRQHHPFDNTYPVDHLSTTTQKTDAPVCRDEVSPAGSDPVPVFSGVDYQAVLTAAEAEADVLIWDGSGSDPPFLRPRLHLVLVDPLRADGAVEYFPGEVCLRLADAILINKCDTVPADRISSLVEALGQINPAAQVFTADSPVTVDGAELLTGRTVVILEEGDSLRLDSIRPGAGTEAARRSGVAAIINPKPYATGSLARFYRRNPAAQVLPVLGDTPDDLAELGQALAAVPSEAIIDASRRDLSDLLPDRPVARAFYSLRPHDPDGLAALARQAVRHRFASADRIR